MEGQEKLLNKNKEIIEKEVIEKEEKEINSKVEKKLLRHKWGFRILGTTIIFFLVCSFFIEKSFSVGQWTTILKFILTLLLAISAILIFNFSFAIVGVQKGFVSEVHQQQHYATQGVSIPNSSSPVS